MRGESTSPTRLGRAAFGARTSGRNLTAEGGTKVNHLAAHPCFPPPPAMRRFGFGTWTLLAMGGAAAACGDDAPGAGPVSPVPSASSSAPPSASSAKPPAPPASSSTSKPPAPPCAGARRVGPGTFFDRVRHLVEGEDARQKGVTPGAITPRRAALVSGTVPIAKANPSPTRPSACRTTAAGAPRRRWPTARGSSSCKVAIGVRANRKRRLLAQSTLGLASLEPLRGDRSGRAHPGFREDHGHHVRGARMANGPGRAIERHERQPHSDGALSERRDGDHDGVGRRAHAAGEGNVSCDGVHGG